MVTTLQISAYRVRGHAVHTSEQIEVEINGAMNVRAVLEAAQKAINEATERYNASRKPRAPRQAAPGPSDE
jgi:hypothetical protein